MNRFTILAKKRHKRTLKKMPAIVVAAVLAATVLTGCKQAGTEVQAAETGTTAQVGEAVTAVQAAETDATAQAKEAGTTAQSAETGATAQGKEAEAVSQKSNGYTAKDVEIYDGQPTGQTVPMRFYEAAPHVAYMGIGEYFDLMLGGGLTVQGDDNGVYENGVYQLTNAVGATAVVDTAKGLVTVEDLPSFENYLDPAREGMQSSFKDSPAPYIRLREVVYEGTPQPVTFDLGRLGIAINGDGEDVWFPVSILSTWLSDIAQNRVTYNGKYLYKCNGESQYKQDAEYYNTEYIDGVLQGSPREEDLAAYSYADLGFAFQYMYGYPGTLGLNEETLRKEGLDAALKEHGELGQELAGQLSSTDMRAFWRGMNNLSVTVLEDGHNGTNLNLAILDVDATDRYKSFRDYTWDVYSENGVTPFEQNMMQANMGIFQARPEQYTENAYYASGDTAVILLRAFTVDKEAWDAYYRDGGAIPNDTYGTLAQGLQKAAEDAEIKNVIIDLSTNGGGYTDAAAACISLMTGRDYLCGYNELSKQYFKVYFDIDRNLDGIFDEKDAEFHYDYNYGALVSGASFSCGNMFPFMIRDEGGVVIGERSGGGACSVQMAVLSNGFDYRISGYKFKLTDRQHSDLEPGIEPDIALELPLVMAMDDLTDEEVESKDYSVYGDLDQFCQKASEWFSK